MHDIRPLEDQQALADLISRQPLQPFLQSWAWGEFQHALGRPIWRLGAYRDDQLVGAALVVRHELLLGKTYLYCPRGPVADTPEALADMFAAIRELGLKEGAMYVKADPGIYRFGDDVAQRAAGYSLGTPLQPPQTLVLDVTRAPNEMIESFHQKTRYNIRLAEKRGVTVRWSTTDADLEVFLGLLHQTATRQGIRLHSDQYYRQQFHILQQVGMAELVLGDFNGSARVGHMIIWHGHTATYLHGGSDDTHKDVMAPYLVQWQTILRAHERGCTEYDFWGVAPDDAVRHKWAGVTRFKRGFHGRDIVFPPSLNAILQPQWYQAYRLAKRFRGGVDG